MHKPNNTFAEIEEVVSILTPAPGVTVEQALADARIEGAQKIEPLADGSARITWFKRK